MQKLYNAFFVLALLIPLSVFSQSTVHSSIDTCFNADFSIAYFLNTTIVSEEGKNTVTLAFSEGPNSPFGEITDLTLYRDVDARYKDRLPIAKRIQLPSNGIFVFEDEHETWTEDGGGDYGFTGTGALPANTPYFYAVVVNRAEPFGNEARPRRSTPAIFLPNPPSAVVSDPINSDMTLVTQVFPNPDDTTVILKLDFAPNYDYYQKVLLEETPGEPIYPAGDRLVYFQRVFLNTVAEANGRTNIDYGNLYWGHEGSAYAKFKVSPDLLNSDDITYAFFNGGRPGHASVLPVPIEFDFGGGGGGGGGGTGATTVHSSIDTCFNSDFSIAYFLNTTIVSEEGKNTVTLAFTEGPNSPFGEITDLTLYRDVDARYKDRLPIAKRIQLPSNGIFVFEDEHETWTEDGGGDYGFTGTGALPANTPYFYAVVVNRAEPFGNEARPRRSTPAIFLPNPPSAVVSDPINSDMTLVTQVFPNPDDTTVILKLDFAPNYDYYQKVLLEETPGEPIYPAGDRLVYFQRVFLNTVAEANGRTNIDYGNLYWGHEGSAYAKFKVSPDLLNSDDITYAFFNGGRPGHASVLPVPISFFGVSNASDPAAAPLELSVFPNPTKGLLNIQANENISFVNVYNLNGQIIFSQRLTNGVAPSTQVDLSREASGVYIMQVKTDNYLMNKKVVVE